MRCARQIRRERESPGYLIQPSSVPPRPASINFVIGHTLSRAALILSPSPSIIAFQSTLSNSVSASVLVDEGVDEVVAQMAHHLTASSTSLTKFGSHRRDDLGLFLHQVPNKGV